jgi:predicted DNA-binding transcriptional regulator AlpA
MISSDRPCVNGTSVPVVCLVDDILSALGISERQFYRLRAERRFPIEPMVSLDATVRFSGFDVVDYIKRRGVAAASQAQSVPMRQAGRRRFFNRGGKAKAHQQDAA